MKAIRDMRSATRTAHDALRFGIRLLGFGIFLSACTGLGPPPTVTPPPPPTSTPDTPDPGGTALTFLEDWQKGDYAGMYSLLSPLSRDAISLNDFQARYEAVARATSLLGVETKILSVLKNGPTAHVLYSLTLHTAVVGDIPRDRKSTRLNSSHSRASRMPSSA